MKDPKSFVKLFDLNVPVIEYGSLTENYGKNEMPIRLDYTDKYITTDPEVKNKQWINVLIGEEENLGLPHHGCSGVYTLDNSMGKDLLVGGEQIIINKKCNESLMGASYDGSFEYNCNVIEYKQAMEIIEEYKIEEDLQNTKNKEVFENNEEVEVDSAGERRIDDNDNYDSNNPEDVKKAIEQMKLEMKADQTD